MSALTLISSGFVSLIFKICERNIPQSFEEVERENTSVTARKDVGAHVTAAASLFLFVLCHLEISLPKHNWMSNQAMMG